MSDSPKKPKKKYTPQAKARMRETRAERRKKVRVLAERAAQTPPVEPLQADEMAQVLLPEVYETDELSEAELLELRDYSSLKIQALDSAMRDGAKAASKKFGVPRRTLSKWLADPTDAEAAAARRRLEIDLSDKIARLAFKATAVVEQMIDEGAMKPRDAIVFVGVLVDKLKVLRSAATPNVTINAGDNARFAVTWDTPTMAPAD